jgi:hypothetical protein
MLIKALFRLDDSFRQPAQAHREGYYSLFYRSLLKGYGGEGICSMSGLARTTSLC